MVNLHRIIDLGRDNSIIPLEDVEELLLLSVKISRSRNISQCQCEIDAAIVRLQVAKCLYSTLHFVAC